MWLVSNIVQYSKQLLSELFCHMKTVCAESTACFLAVDHSGSFHYFSVICRKHGEQVRRLALRQKDLHGLMTTYSGFTTRNVLFARAHLPHFSRQESRHLVIAVF